MNTLLIPTDFSPVANNAIKYAIDMALAYKLDVSLLHVVLLSTPSVSNVVYIDVATDFQKEAEEHMAFYVNTLKEKYPSLNFTHKVETGLFLDSLKRSCDDLSPVAIVMGITGIGSIGRSILKKNCCRRIGAIGTFMSTMAQISGAQQLAALSTMSAFNR